MKRRAVRRPRSTTDSGTASAAANTLRIVGGELRGRRLGYSGDLRVRPMKDRTREAVFNLVGPEVRGTHVWDLFAGTGALALEALSRGAATATLIERHIPTARQIQQNIAELNLQPRTRVVRADVFHLVRANFASQVDPIDPTHRWLVFCSPPYALYDDEPEHVKALLTSIHERAPAESLFVIEAEAPFDFSTLLAGNWSTRKYAPAAVGILRLPAAN